MEDTSNTLSNKKPNIYTIHVDKSYITDSLSKKIKELNKEVHDLIKLYKFYKYYSLIVSIVFFLFLIYS